MYNDSNAPAFKILQNITIPWDSPQESAPGDVTGLIPISYLDRILYYQQINDTSKFVFCFFFICFCLFNLFFFVCKNCDFAQSKQTKKNTHILLKINKYSYENMKQNKKKEILAMIGK